MPAKYRPIRRMARSSLEQREIWHLDGQRAKFGWSTGSQRLRSSKDDQIQFNCMKIAEEYETSTMSTFDMRNELTKIWTTWPGKEWRVPTGILPNGNLRWANISRTKFILTRNLLTRKMISRAQAYVNYETDRLILSDCLQYKRQHMTLSSTTHLANRHKQRTDKQKLHIPSFRPSQR